MAEVNLALELELAAAAAKAKKARGSLPIEPGQAQQPAQTGLLEQTGSGVNEGIAAMLGMPVDAVAAVLNAASGLANRGFGINIPEITAPVGGSESLRSALSPLISETEPQTAAQRFGRRVGQEVGAGAVVAPIAIAAAPLRSAAVLATDVAADIGSGVGAQAATEIAPDSLTAELIGSIAGGVVGATGGIAAIAGAGRRTADRELAAAVADTPSVKELKIQAGSLYDAAQRNGITATIDQTGDFANKMTAIALDEGLISPAGRVAKSSPKIRDVLRMTADFSGSTMTPKQMRQVRKSLSNAAGSADPSEARIGVKMLRAFDEFTSPLTPEIAEANRLFTQAMRGDMIDVAVELAGARAGQFTGSGFENALRTEFRKLDRQIINKKLKGLSKEQIEAIKKVARGGPIENILRGIGKAAPTGVVSAGIGGGMPFLIGTSIGGPALGTAAAIGTMGTGTVARKLATGATIRNADTSAALMRGMTLPKARQNPEVMKQLIATWLSQQVATQPE